jgi:hypothetical protein
MASRFPVLFLLLTQLSGPAFAVAEEGCDGEFSRLSSKGQPDEAALSAANPKEKKFRELEATPVSAIFPNRKMLNGQEVFEIDAASKKAFQEHFDAYWDSRVKAGLISKQEVAKFRDWLFSNSDNLKVREHYPQLNHFKTELEAAKGLNLSAFHDAIFLKYVEETTGGMNPNSVEAYVKSLGTKSGGFNLDLIGRLWHEHPKWQLPTVIIVQVLAGKLIFQNKNLNVTTHVNGYRGYEWMFHRKQYDQLGKSVGDLEFNLLPAWQNTSYAGIGNQLQRTADFLGKADQVKARLQPLLELGRRSNPDFNGNLEEILRDHLAELKQSMDEIQRLNAENKVLASKTKKSSDEGARLLSNQKNLGAQEHAASGILADWLLYSWINGPSDIKDTLSLSYPDAMKAYLEQGDADQLRDAVTKKLRQYLGILEDKGKVKLDAAGK